MLLALRSTSCSAPDGPSQKRAHAGHALTCSDETTRVTLTHERKQKEEKTLSKSMNETN